MCLIRFVDDFRHAHYLELNGFEDEAESARAELESDIWAYILQHDDFIDTTPENSEFTPENFHDAANLLELLIDSDLDIQDVDGGLFVEYLWDIVYKWGKFTWADVLGY